MVVFIKERISSKNSYGIERERNKGQAKEEMVERDRMWYEDCWRVRE